VVRGRLLGINQKLKNQNIMLRLALLFSLLFTLNVAANSEKDAYTSELNSEFMEAQINQFEIEDTLFENFQDETLEVEDIEVIELEETADIDFDTKQYLPKRFNANKGIYDIDWNTTQLIEIDEEVELSFDTKRHLPKNFNPYKDMLKKNVNEVVVSLY